MPAVRRSRIASWIVAVPIATGMLLALGWSLELPSTAATVTLDMSIPSFTSLDASGCATGTPGITEIGPLLPSGGTTSSRDCVVTFNANTDGAELHLGQADLGGDAANYVPDSTVLGRWPLEGPLPLTDGEVLADSDAGTTGLTLGSGATRPATTIGPVGHGNALSFDGNDTASAASDAAWNATQFTVEVWFRTTDVASSFDNMVNRGDDSSYNMRQFSLEIDNSCHCFKANTSFSGGNQQIQTPAAGYQNGAWHLATYTVDGARKQRFYLDGLLKVTSPARGGTVDLPAKPIRLGSQYSPPSQYWIGSLDDLRITAGAASDAEVRNRYLARLGDFDGAAHHWLTNSNMFGACLNSVAGTGSVNGTTWSPGTCAQSDAAGWQAVAATTATAGAIVARQPTSGGADAIANIRFGAHAETAQIKGTYEAPLVFEVDAP